MSTERKPRPYRIALTGGIASGKTTVADMFTALGIAVIDTDVIAREVVQPGEPALAEIRERFGDSVFDADGQLDRKALRKDVFADNQARHDLEAILHPRIGAETRRQADAARGPYQVIVVPLLVGSTLTSFVDRIATVDCDEQTQILRLLARDTESVEQARKILAAQSSRSERLGLADDVIVNDKGLDELFTQVVTLDREYRRLADDSGQPERSPETRGCQTS